jgi:signal transduction histidine kinase
LFSKPAQEPLSGLVLWLHRHKASAAPMVWGVGCGFIALVLSACIAVMALRYNSELADAAQELRTLDLLLTGEADRSLQSVGLVLESVADHVMASGITSDAQLRARTDSYDLYQSFQARLAGLPQIDALTVVDAKGKILIHTREWPAGDWDLSDRRYFKAARDQASTAPHLSEPLLDRYSKQKTVYLARRLSAPDGRFLGVVVGAIRLSYFERFYNSLELTDDGCVALWRQDGVMIAHYSPVLAGKALRYGLVRPSEPWHGVNGVFEAAPTPDDPTGAPRVLATAKTPNFPLQVIIGRSKPALLADWWRETIALAIAASCAVLATIVMLWTVLRRMKTLEAAAAESHDREQAILARKDAEDALRHAQKMDSIGHLAGGIAHDFGNMLAVISASLTIAQKRLEKGDIDVFKQLGAAQDGVRRASSLTQRLLGFTHKRPMTVTSIDINALVGGFSELLGRTLASNIRLELDLEPSLWSARGDISQLENAILNLAVNARDAMPDGGLLTVRTSNQTLTRPSAEALGLDAGDYVIVSIVDSGAGMSPEVLAHAFEPFFTTKGVGRGTGLGLSQVAGFVKDCGGGLSVRSDLGIGTTVTLYLTRCALSSGKHQVELIQTRL